MTKRATVLQRLAQRRAVVQAAMDAAAWVIALSAATALRYDLRIDLVNWAGVASMIPLAIEAQVLAGWAFGLYRGRWRFGSFDEVAALARAAALTTALITVLDLVLSQNRIIPLSSAIGAGPVALILMAGLRYAWRLKLESRRRPTGLDGTRLLVFGAGEGGAQVITAMLRDPNSPYFPVGLLDDDPEKRNLEIMGVRVLGDRTQLAKTAEDTGAEALLIAIPSASAALISDLNDLAGPLELAVKVLPPVRDLFGANPSLSDIRDVNIADLLGRHQIETNVDEIAGYITGKRVLVTGAGGSIGSELCRQLHQFGPTELLMLDRDESALHSVQLSIEGRALLESPNLLLADIRDIEQINRLFEEHKPQVVFHAAALKHLTLLERNPGEAVKSNIWGTLTILDASKAHGVERFVNISTDKAADPCSVLGYSKRIAERLTAHVAQEADGVYLSVRFGNVLGSRGSVLTTFKEQIAEGGPLTVTDPNVTRYFMTVQEAVQLVIQAGAIGKPGEALVLDMGDPVRIADVARQLGDQADRSIRIVYTGLRPGEKLHEKLLASDETDIRPMHPLISQVPVSPLHPDAARALDPWNAHDEVIHALTRLCSASVRAEFQPGPATRDA